jgi:glycosyltransferase involved in cell wall biosynthesis
MRDGVELMSTLGPLVSVVIPAYNSEGTISSTLESVLEQTYGNLDVVVIDDGSTDATPKNVRAFFSDPRVRLIQQTNQGVVAARNPGVQETRGEFVAPCDADDLWHPTKIEKQMKVMHAGGEELALVYTL